MTKNQLIEKVSSSTGYGKWEIEHIFNSIIVNIGSALSEGERVSLGDFGAFCAKHRASRTARNLKTNEALPIPAKTVPAFEAGEYLKKTVSG